MTDLLLCPGCRGRLDRGGRCHACGHSVARDGSVLDFVGRADLGRAPGAVNAFYERNPFPGYAPGDDAGTLIDRGRSMPFAMALDVGAGPRARILDCGCGTAQVACFLALRSAARSVVGVDLCRASLAEADRFKLRAGIENLDLVRADLFAPPLPERSFDLVVCRGVVHHTERPYDAVRSVARLVAPGGLIVLGYYDRVARFPHTVRRAIARACGAPLAFLDPVLRRRDLDAEKKRRWIEDQYRHPLEHQPSLARIHAALRAEGLSWLRSVPPPPERDGIQRPTPRPGFAGGLMLRLRWLARGLFDQDAGLVAVVARRYES